MIKDLSSNTNIKDGYFILKFASVRQTKSGSDYLDSVLSDKSGELSAKKWDWDTSVEAPVGSCVKVSAQVTEYNGNLQAVIKTMEKVDIEDVPNKADIVKTVPRNNVPDLIAFLKSTVEKEIPAGSLHDLLIDVVQEMAAHPSMPAAKSVHHDIVGGLVQHVTEMVIIAQHLLDGADIVLRAYQKKDEDFAIQRDLVIAAVICHDIGKLREFEQGELGLVSDYSVDGNLMGHIYMGAEHVHDLCKKHDVDEETERILKSMILSHHGIPEYGSAITPRFLEAYLLHEIDDIDAKLYVFRQTVSSTEEGQMSDPVWGLDRTRVYHLPK